MWLGNLLNLVLYPRRYLSSFIVNDDLKKKPLVCIMCGYNEFENIGKALAGLVGKVDKLIFVDKNGALKEHIMNYSNILDIDYYVKPELNLLESRRFAISKAPKDVWIIVVDADEIVLVNSHYLRNLLFRNVCYKTKKQIIHSAFDTIYAMNTHHPFIMYNDGGIHFKPLKDVPRYAGRSVNLDIICIENRAWCKSKRQQYYRTNYWRKWQNSEYKHLPIEHYIFAIHGEIPDDETVNEWYDWIISKGIQT